MAGNAEGRILSPQSLGIEPGTMRAEPEAAANGRVTRRTVALDMAADAGLEALSRGLPMAETEAAEGVVIALRPQAPRGHESRALVA